MPTSEGSPQLQFCLQGCQAAVALAGRYDVDSGASGARPARRQTSFCTGRGESKKKLSKKMQKGTSKVLTPSSSIETHGDLVGTDFNVGGKGVRSLK
jgi:hypothetical protein